MTNDDSQLWLMLQRFFSAFVLLLTSAMIFSTLEPNFSLAKSLYFLASTLTTAGFGDTVPETGAAQLFSCVFIFASWGLLARLLSSATKKALTQFASRLESELEPPSPSFRVKRIRRKIFASIGGILANIAISVLAYGFQNPNATWVTLLYAAVVSVSTVGYGDVRLLDPETASDGAFLLGAIYVLGSVFATATCVSTLLSALSEQHRAHLRSTILKKRLTRQEVVEADFDGDGVISESEWCVQKLRQLGHVPEDVLADLRAEFRSQVKKV